jgi:hypothetical protein
VRKQLLIAFSLANLCLFNAWREVLSPEVFAHLYFWKQSPALPALAALALNVSLLMVLFFTGYRLAMRFGGVTTRAAARVVFLLLFLRALNGVRLQFEGLGTRELRLLFGRVGFFAIELSLFALLVFAVARYGLGRVARGAALAALILSPFGLVGLAQATWLTVKYGRPVWSERPPAPRIESGASGRPRVLWLIFDEMGERPTFEGRPAGLSLPELDRLRGESLFASNAFPPAGHTSQSIPALLTGRLVSAVRPSGPGELSVTLAGTNAPVGWDTLPDVFSSARAGGSDTALVGWYHPYCRVIGDRLTFCRWEAASQRIDSSKLSLINNLLRQELGLLKLFPSAGRLADAGHSGLERRGLEAFKAGHLADYRELLSTAEGVASDKSFGLTLIHLPVPHPPGVFNRSRGAFDTSGNGSYLDNLALADRTLGLLRSKMEGAGLWEKTTVVLSSDHWWRTDYWNNRPFWSPGDEALWGGRVDRRVPFLVKLAGEKTATTYEAPFNTVLTHDLILDVLSRKVATHTDLAAWLDAHRTIGESPYQSYEDEE